MRWIYVGALLLVCFLAAGSQYSSRVSEYGNPPLQPGSDLFHLQLLETTTARAYADSPVPYIAVRFDDGRVKQYENGEIQNFLRLRIPVTLLINPWSIGTDGAMTWDMLRDLKQLASSLGTRIEIIFHNNTAFYSGLEPDSLSVQNYRNEFTSGFVRGVQGSPFDNIIMRELGVSERPRVVQTPGDASVRIALARTHAFAIVTADQEGYAFAGIGNASSTDSLATAIYMATNPNQDDMVTAIGGGAYFTGLRLGELNNPYEIPKGWTIDLGSTVVERDGDEYADLIGTVSEWKLDGRSSDVNADASKTWAYRYQLASSQNLSFIIAMHDSARTNTQEDSPGVGVWERLSDVTEAEYEGAFSPAYVAATIYKMREKGHYRTGTVTDMLGYVFCKPYPGMDLINNPSMTIMQNDIGDTSGVEYAWVRGLSSAGWAAGTGAWSSTRAFQWYDELGNGVNGKYGRDGSHPDDLVSRSVDGFKGIGGGARFASASDADAAIFRIIQSRIDVPGRYRFLFGYRPDEAANSTVRITEHHLGGQIKLFNTAASWQNSGGIVVPDSLFTYYARDNNVTFDIDSNINGDNLWVHLPVEFRIPRDIPSNVAELYTAGVNTASPGINYRNPTDVSWTWSMELHFFDPGTISYPMLLYLGE